MNNMNWGKPVFDKEYWKLSGDRIYEWKLENNDYLEVLRIEDDAKTK